jgi:hypothetical protein
MYYSPIGKSQAFIACVAISIPLTAQSFSIGPLKIGMTNAEVIARVPLTDCKQIEQKMVCAGKISTKTISEIGVLTFDRRSKRLERVDLRLMDWASDDPRLATLFTELNFSPCKPSNRYRELDWYVKDECIEAPDQLRQVLWDPGHTQFRRTVVRSIRITITHIPGVYQNLLKEKTLAQKKAEKISSDRKAAAQFAKGR